MTEDADFLGFIFFVSERYIIYLIIYIYIFFGVLINVPDSPKKTEVNEVSRKMIEMGAYLE